MSQLADIKDVVIQTPLPPFEKAKLFFEIMQALGWEIDGVKTVEDAQVFLEM
jgi:hypothetical protein